MLVHALDRPAVVLVWSHRRSNGAQTWLQLCLLPLCCPIFPLVVVSRASQGAHRATNVDCATKWRMNSGQSIAARACSFDRASQLLQLASPRSTIERSKTRVTLPTGNMRSYALICAPRKHQTAPRARAFASEHVPTFVAELARLIDELCAIPF